MANSLLVIRAGALGDVVLTLPVIRALRQQHPGVLITVVGYPDLWSLAGDGVDEAVSIDDPLFTTLFTASPDDHLMRWLRRFDEAIAWTSHDLARAFAAAGVPCRHASPYPPPGVHATAWLARSTGLELPPDTAPPLAGDHAGGQTIFIHPGAGAAWKRWPAENFAEVVDHLLERGHTVTLLEGPADEEAVTAVLRRMSGNPTVLRNPPLPVLAGTLAGARLFIGNDSGVTHLAAAAGAPVLALFGPTDPANWAPLGNTHILRACRRHASVRGPTRVCDDPDCMAGIAVADVMSAADTILGA